ncbi:MAG: transcription elongation factor GreA [Fimbriimonadaceae bacterium]|nr:transcription elongation factor GreA [Fimbriimonadaceae bacterium]
MNAHDIEILDRATETLLTPEGFEAMKQELHHLTMVKRPEIADRIRDSQDHGEFSEDNSELDEVKFEQAIVENRIADLKAIFSTARVLDVKQIPTDRAGLGSFVRLRDEEFGDEFTVRIVTSVEADPEKDYISNESPMGAALIGHPVGAVVDVDAPQGRQKYAVLTIAREA